MRKAIATLPMILLMSSGFILCLIMLGSLFFYPNLWFGPFISVQSGQGWVDRNGEIQINLERTVHRSAPSGYYAVRVDRLLPEPATLICHSSAHVPYAKLGPGVLQIDLGYYMADQPGRGREICPTAYTSDVIQVRTIWCQRRLFDNCIGPVEMELPIVIDMREG